MSKVYEVYLCRYKGRIVYIGEGVRGRHKHCNSGCSHVYSLNRIHFLEGSEALDVEVLEESSSKGEVSNKEKELIKLYDPEYNKNFTGRHNALNNMAEGKIFKSEILFYGFSTESSVGYRLKYEALCKEFVDYFGYSNIQKGNISILSAKHYSNIKKPRLSSLSRWMREARTANKVNNSVNYVLYMYFKEVKNIDLREHLV